jgi:single-stranded DNA-binding protein
MRGIVSGSLFKEPLEKTSTAGKPYVLATIVEKAGAQKRWIKAFIFSESACAEVRRLGDGDPIAVAGEIDGDVYAPDGGEPRVNWKITVDAVLSAHRPTKAKAVGEGRKAANGRERAGSSWAAPGNQVVEHRLRDAMLPALNEAFREGIASARNAPKAGDFNDEIPF